MLEFHKFALFEQAEFKNKGNALIFENGHYCKLKSSTLSMILSGLMVSCPSGHPPQPSIKFAFSLLAAAAFEGHPSPPIAPDAAIAFTA
ncbi:hypothetical protein WR25_12373 [Diploscapter pachys]|uniref:Uncharacterized protein n=1 Tax=Diploscapter pachys TaxID=2018661 RepID=A0A2A2J9I8_9BILA|nr:hypothetical protein WR25_12373 [Diploscapter pachys]